MASSPLLIAAGVGAVALVSGLVIYFFRRPSPDERERRRRLKVYREGRITDGTITDIADSEDDHGADSQQLIHYSYSIGGVEYSACQDISGLAEIVGNDPSLLVGAVYVKYQPKNPYNSIIVCEGWSGMRSRRRI